DWRPTKYQPKGDSWAISSDIAELSPASSISASMALSATLPALQKHVRGDLADFGCGTAPFYGAYGPLSQSVCWIDWPSSPHETQHLDVIADLNLPVEIADNQFDTIFTSSVLEHIWKHDVFWDEMTRTLRPDGKIILIVPFMYWLHEEPHDYFRWTRHALTKACEERGLEVVELKSYGGGIDLLADLCVRALAAISLTLAKLIGRPLARLLGHSSMQSRGKTAREKLPLGYILVAQKPSA
ncbi:MAG: methyltransferase domain-containing protein, partial [Marinomonas sp.]